MNSAAPSGLEIHGKPPTQGVALGWHNTAPLGLKSHKARLHTARGRDETIRRNANGVRAIKGLPASAPTPVALGLNVELAHSETPEVYLGITGRLRCRRIS